MRMCGRGCADFNQPGCSTENCGEHVDRGFFSLILCSDVAGLQVRDASTLAWHTPEETLEPYKHAVLINNKSLEVWSTLLRLLAEMVMLILMSSRRPQLLTETLSGAAFAYSACIHRVKRAEGCERISVSYELRLDQEARLSELCDTLKAACE